MVKVQCHFFANYSSHDKNWKIYEVCENYFCHVAYKLSKILKNISSMANMHAYAKIVYSILSFNVVTFSKTYSSKNIFKDS